MSRIVYNERLPPLPDEDAIVEAVRELATGSARFRRGVTAQAIAWHLGVDAARRLGNGAVQGSWSGSMAPALRLSPRLRSMAKRGLLLQLYDEGARTRFVYALPYDQRHD